MYEHGRWQGKEAREVAARPVPSGAGFDDADEVETLILTVSTIDDPGNDWELWEAFNTQGDRIAIRKRFVY